MINPRLPSILVVLVWSIIEKFFKVLTANELKANDPVWFSSPAPQGFYWKSKTIIMVRSS